MKRGIDTDERAAQEAARTFFAAHRGQRVKDSISGRVGTLEACIWTRLHVRMPSGLEFTTTVDRLSLVGDE